MKTCCEICGKPTKDKVSYLELKVWDFDFIKEEKKEFYPVCFECFDKQTEQQIEKDTAEAVRKERSDLYKQLVKEGVPCLVCGEPLTIGHICNHDE
jgi:hypothetical protein